MSTERGEMSWHLSLLQREGQNYFTLTDAGKSSCSHLQLVSMGGSLHWMLCSYGAHLCSHFITNHFLLFY